MDYGELLTDIRWRSKSKQIKERDGNKCVNCGDIKMLQVHHRQYHYVLSLRDYKKPWDYPLDVLITLCKACHDEGHKQFKIPTIKI
jgi:5-methylcytosine-specific restriction endonuclease McrA